MPLPSSLLLLAAARAETQHLVLAPESSDHIVESAHFVARWNDGDEVPLEQSAIAAGLAELERIRAYFCGTLGFPAPYAGAPEAFKTDVFLSNQGWAAGAGTGERHPAMWLHHAAFGDPSTLAHEYVHCLQFASLGLRDSPYVGWFWESHAEWMTFQLFPDGAGCSAAYVESPHLYYGSTRTRYCNWQFFEYIKDRCGYQAIHDIWLQARQPGEEGQNVEDPLLVLRRSRGWDQATLGDHFGAFAAANVTWDYERGAVLRAAYGNFDPDVSRRVTQLDEDSARPGWFHVPDYWAPQRYGYNHVRLAPGRNVRRIELKFDGHVQEAPAREAFAGQFENEPASLSAPASDWRVQLVAVDSSGQRRSSAALRGSSGELTLDVRPDDREHWLVVAATPLQHHSIAWDQTYYSIYRYPWSVHIEGATPYRRARNADIAGAPHPNGGGFVASTAQVAPTAYVGADAEVLDSAVVSDSARIEGRARVSGNARVTGRALLRGRAHATGSARIDGAANLSDDTVVRGGLIADEAELAALTHVDGDDTVIRGRTRIAAVIGVVSGTVLSGETQLLGDLELHGAPQRGVFYGFVVPETATDARHGAERTAPEREVTASVDRRGSAR